MCPRSENPDVEADRNALGLAMARKEAAAAMAAAMSSERAVAPPAASDGACWAGSSAADLSASSASSFSLVVRSRPLLGAEDDCATAPALVFRPKQA